MSVREYIGARYVPVFADPAEWDATKTYEPLTVVLYQGNSYTSRQSVPANIPITNETYWAQTGNYNAQVEQYRQEVATFNGRITANANDIDSLEGKLPASSFSSTDTVKKYVDDQDTQIRTDFEAADTQIRTDFEAADTQIRTDFAAADTQIRTDFAAADTAIRNIIPASEFSSDNTVKDYIDGAIYQSGYRKAIYLGNSYAVGTGSSSGDNGIYARTKHFFNESELVWVSGVGFASYNYSNISVSNSFQNMLEAKAQEMTELDRNTVTDIIVLSAVGDDRVYLQYGSIYYYLQPFCQAAKQYFPNAKVRLFLLSANLKALTGNVSPATVAHLHNTYKTIGRYGAIYGGYLGYFIAHNDQMFSSDGYHPNDNGYEYMAGQMLQVLSGQAIEYPVYSGAVTFTNTVNSHTLPAWIIQYSDTLCTMKFNNALYNGANDPYTADEVVPGEWTCDVSNAYALRIVTPDVSTAWRESSGGIAYVNALTSNRPFSPFAAMVSGTTWKATARVAVGNSTIPSGSQIAAKFYGNFIL